MPCGKMAVISKATWIVEAFHGVIASNGVLSSIGVSKTWPFFVRQHVVAMPWLFLNRITYAQSLMLEDALMQLPVILQSLEDLVVHLDLKDHLPHLVIHLVLHYECGDVSPAPSDSLVWTTTTTVFIQGASLKEKPSPTAGAHMSNFQNLRNRRYYITYFRRSYSQKDSTATLTYHDQRTLVSHWDHQFSPNPQER